MMKKYPASELIKKWEREELTAEQRDIVDQWSEKPARLRMPGGETLLGLQRRSWSLTPAAGTTRSRFLQPTPTVRLAVSVRADIPAPFT